MAMNIELVVDLDVERTLTPTQHCHQPAEVLLDVIRGLYLLHRPVEAAEVLASYLLELDDADSAVKLMVEKAVESQSWAFLLQLFVKGDTTIVRQRVADCLMCMTDGSKTYMHKFIKELLEYIAESGLHLELASGLFGCIVLSGSASVDTRKTCLKELLGVNLTDNSIFERDHSHLNTYTNMFSDPVYSVILGAEHVCHSACCASSIAELVDNLIRALQSDSDETYQKCALGLAAHLGKWDLAWVMQKHGAAIDFRLLKTSLLVKAFKYIGQLVQKCMDMPYSAHSLFSVHKVRKCVQKHFVFGKQEFLPVFLEECKNSHLYVAATCIALWTKQLAEARKMAFSAFTQSEEKERFMSEVLHAHHYCLALELLTRMPRGYQFQKMVKCILQRAADRCYSPPAKVAVKKLLNLCTDQVFMVDEVLFQILEHCESDLFCIFVAKDPVDLSRACLQITGHVFNTIVTYLSQYSKISRESRSARGKKAAVAYRIMFHKCIEAGLSTRPTEVAACIAPGILNPFGVASPLETAARTQNFDLVQILYNTGATNNAELYRLAQDSKLRFHLESKQQKDLLDYLDLKASNPRSLEDLCVLTVSHNIGCRADRKYRALSLGLPMNLVRKILFEFNE